MKRELDLRSADEVIAEIERLRDGGYAKSKRWNLTQICQHLHETMQGAMDGFGFRLPWILRVIAKKIFFRALKTRKLASGAPTFRQLKPTASPGEDDSKVIDQCIATIRKADQFDGSVEDHPLVDGMSVDQWRDFMWLHASHHLAFLQPKTPGSA